MNQPVDHSFRPHHRFHTKRDYGRVFYQQQKAAGKHLVVMVAPRPRKAGKSARLGIMVGTKVHKRAVRRHQLKRWVREYFRVNLKELAHGYDVVVLFRSNPPDDGHALIDAELAKLFPKALAAPAKPGSRSGPRKRK